MTLLVCSSCLAPLPEASSHCPRCGPGSLALISDERLALVPVRPDEAAAARLGRALGSQYRVIRLVGRGGFAEVYEVQEDDLRRRLAVKVLRSDLPWGPGTLSRFKQEARAIARLSHPNTVPIHFVGEGEGLVFYAMPFLEGRTLTELLRAEGPLPVERALAIVEPIVDALQHAHDNGLVHRDVKPDNILIEAGSGRPLLVDFGIVKDLAGPAHVTESGFIVGTPLYMSPEQALGTRVDARTDLYGLGVVLFQLLTGAPPFEGSDSQEIVGRHLQEPVPLAGLSRDGIPPWLSRIVVRCMAKRPDDRFPTARELRDALRAGRAAMLTPAVSAPSYVHDSPTETIPVSQQRRRGAPWVIVGVAAVGTVAATFAGTLASRPEPAPAPALVVENRLAQSIALTLEDTGFTIAPGDSVRIAVARDRPVEAHWAVVQPASLAGRLLGKPVQGTIVTDPARGELREVVDAETGGEVWFAPVLINRASRPLAVSILTGGDSLDCDCVVAPGDSVALGYYPLAEPSALLVGDEHGWSARLDSLDEVRNPVTGSVVFRVDSTVLVAPPAPRPARSRSGAAPATPAAPVRRNPLGAFLPSTDAR